VGQLLKLLVKSVQLEFVAVRSASGGCGTPISRLLEVVVALVDALVLLLDLALLQTVHTKPFRQTWTTRWYLVTSVIQTQYAGEEEEARSDSRSQWLLSAAALLLKLTQKPTQQSKSELSRFATEIARQTVQSGKQYGRPMA
jgi:hypothetical protein